jgi:hypothetical protein
MSEAIDTAQDNTAADSSTSTDQPVTQPEGQPEGQATAASGDQDGKPTQEGNAYHGAPEAYEDLTIPEGVQVDDEMYTEYKNLGKKLDLNQDGMQEMTNLYVKLQQRGAEQVLSAYQAQQEDWLGATKADAEIGGAQYETTKSLANLFIDKMGNEISAALMQPFDAKDNPTGTGLGGHPEMMRLFANAGKLLAPDQSTQSAGATLSPQERLQKLYPNTKL